MSTRRQDVVLRLTTKGREEVVAALKSIGGEGEKAAKQLERASKPASRGLKAIDSAAGDARDGLNDMAQRAGPVGRALGHLGPGGLAAAAGIGAIALALGGALRISREAVAAFDEIGKRADTLRLSTDGFQALTLAANEEGIAFEKIETGVRALTERQSQLTKGQGELYSRLKDTHPELLKQLAALDSNDDRLRLITQALKNANSETERNTIAYAAFGEAGLEVARMLERQEGGYDGLLDRSREMGIVEEEAIRRAETYAGEMGELARQIDVNLKQAFVDLAPVMIEAYEFAADVSSGIRDITAAIGEMFDAIRTDNSVARGLVNMDAEIEGQLGLLRELRAARRDFGAPGAPGPSGRAQGAIDQVRALYGSEGDLKDLERTIAEVERKYNGMLATRRELAQGNYGGNRFDAEDLRRRRVEAGIEPPEPSPPPPPPANVPFADPEADARVAARAREYQKQADAAWQEFYDREEAQAEQYQDRADQAWDEFFALEQANRELAASIAAEADRFNRQFATPEQARDFALSDLAKLADDAAANGTPINAEAYERALQGIADAYDYAEASGSRFASTQDEIAYGLEALADNSAETGDVFRSVIRRMLMDLIDLEGGIAKASGLLRSFIDDLFSGGSGGGGGGFLSGLIGFGASLFGGGSGASGGTPPPPVHSGVSIRHIPTSHSGGPIGAPKSMRGFSGPDGLPVFPGERALIARTDQALSPPGGFNGPMGGGPVFQMSNDFRGADPSMQTVIMNRLSALERAIKALAKSGPSISVAAVNDRMLRTGQART